ncbi:isocitrate/isopropylmalate family dehydrogenase [Streptomyces dysideae]|uniref:Isopropylmalate dehydrogenase-like domain-containing protein n=1 Tax=Streptomyces dysideae TaxID=909626 RepID=A0A117S041_9ACTN|nr:isocitrate/isopropylmalate family dehydrogenase [Streptomyces dysideae]KUO18842.1 hypothetical protein AQJ91_23570 [Streptomyces dysideae]
MFEPVHGSAPGMAGHGLANPIGAVGSKALMRTHFGLANQATRLRKAIEANTGIGTLTRDVRGTASTEEVTKARYAAYQAAMKTQVEQAMASPFKDRIVFVPYNGFLTCCKATDCLPDVMTWHTLGSPASAPWSPWASGSSVVPGGMPAPPPEGGWQAEGRLRAPASRSGQLVTLKVASLRAVVVVIRSSFSSYA